MKFLTNKNLTYFCLTKSFLAFPNVRNTRNTEEFTHEEKITISSNGATEYFHEALQNEQNKRKESSNFIRSVDDYDGLNLEPFKMEGTMNTIFSFTNPETIEEAEAIKIEEDLIKNDNGFSRFGLIFRIPVINNYGCWCYGGEYWPGARDHSGQGKVVDVYDDACKAHHMGFDCINMDSFEKRIECYPNEQDYTLLIIPQKDGSYSMECDNNIQDDWCRKRTCLVDLRFLARTWKLQNDGIQPDYEKYGHIGFHQNRNSGNGGNFDDKVCATNYNPNKTNPNKPGLYFAEKVCCGDYPYRVWYDAKNTEGISCCAYEDKDVSENYGFSINVGVLYNENNGKCCESGPVNGNSC